MAKKKFRVDVWDTSVTICTTVQEYNKDTKSDESDEGSNLHLYHFGRSTIYINTALYKPSDEILLASHIGHESTHAAMRIISDRGVVTENDNHETLAYTQDYIFRECYKFIKQQMTKS